MSKACNQIIVQSIILFVIAFFYNNVTASNRMSNKNFLSADVIIYDSNTKCIRASGNVSVIAEGYIITADNMVYNINRDELFANGKVRVKSSSKTSSKQQFQIDGDSIFFENKMKSGVIKNFIIYFGDNALLASSLAERLDENHSVLNKSEYTACAICKNRSPIWSISSKKTHLDLAKEKIIYQNVFFKLYGLPIFFTPYFAHPTPKAKAKSGLLIPSKNKAGVGMPIYYRPKDNFDNTTTPRFSKKGIILENETRYLTENGIYNTNISFIRSNLTRKLNNNSKSAKYDRFYINSKAALEKNDYNYGYDFNKTSDKAYLKEYYDRNDPHLTSNIYLEKINKSNFSRIEGLHFQNLKSSEQENSNSYVLPEINIKKIMPVIDDSSYLILENNMAHYVKSSDYKVTRNNFTSTLSKTYNSNDGYLFNIAAYNRVDFYNFNVGQERPSYQKSIAARDIPELQCGLKYPLIKTSVNGDVTIIEPEIQFVEGLGNYKKNLKYSYIDINAYDLNEVNLFSANRFSGFDFHEYGRRVSYGIKANSNQNNGLTLKGFIGKLDYLTNTGLPYKNADLLLKSSIDYNDMIELYYNSKIYSKNLSKYREELGIRYNDSKVYTNVTFINVNPSIYYSKDILNLYSNGIKQMFVDTKYYIDSSWSVGYDIRFNLTSSKKISTISRNIKMTYQGDCVNISLRIGKIYTEDPTRGIYKTGSSSISLNLKTLSF